jgi:trans-aconitate methyltransferase
VTKSGDDVFELLKAKPQELILDLGCGNGALTNKIAESGANVVGIDSSPQMIEQAQHNYPEVEFKTANGCDFTFNYQFDAVFSNAALHWMKPPEPVIDRVYTCLKSGGRFVFEMGGHNNIKTVLACIIQAAERVSLTHVDVVNYFPTLGTYSKLLENAGFRVDYAQTINRPTKLDGQDGFRNWIKMFRNGLLQQMTTSQHEDFFNAAEEIARPYLFHDDIWWADYVRLRAIATKV